jgi:DNA repair protein REV1
MFLGRAKQLCPELIVLYYDFEGYEEVSEQLLEILHRLAAAHDGSVEPVSCDEAYMELLLADDDGNSHERAGDLAESIRRDVFETTQCTASIGVADNKFLAKLGTDRVKPNASFVVRDYRMLLEGLRLRDLHGIGYRTEPKLAAEGLVSVRDVWDLGSNAEGILSRAIGPGLGEKVFMYCQGQDDRPVKSAERKTIGAEVRWLFWSVCLFMSITHSLSVQLWRSIRWSVWDRSFHARFGKRSTEAHGGGRSTRTTSHLETETAEKGSETTP